MQKYRSVPFLLIYAALLFLFSRLFPTLFNNPFLGPEASYVIRAGVCCFALGFYRLKESNQKPESASGDLMPLMWFVLDMAIIAYVGVSAVLR
jgi:hypothetical protein